MSACAGCLMRGGCGGAAFAPLALFMQGGKKALQIASPAPVKPRSHDGSPPGARRVVLWVLAADETAVRVFRKNSCGEKAFSEITPETGGSGIDQISEWLDAAQRGGAFDRLVLIAAPRASGRLRLKLSHAVQSSLIAEVSKDLMALPEEKLQGELKKIVWF